MSKPPTTVTITPPPAGDVANALKIRVITLWGQAENLKGPVMRPPRGDKIAKAVAFLDAALTAINAAIQQCGEAADNAALEQALAAGYQHLADARYWYGVVIGMQELDPAQELAALRHKDNRADRDFIRGWYRDNRARFPSKDAAAEAAALQKLVNQTFRTIRGYLNNI